MTSPSETPTLEELLEQAREDYRSINRLRSERDRFCAALKHLAEPNWAAKARGQDARDMAFYARNVLKEAGVDVED